MFQNIKVEIIYYKTATDFEMEFNLSGCCRMRLLTDKAPDKKTMVNQLARAVNRSRIIMITGSLFGDEGVIKTAASAIGRKLSVVDNEQYGIDSEDKIEIIENAIPLVSKDGVFGGCIIEQGPQTLIVLTENKDLRKNIMQNLIHPYIKDICAAELTDKQDETENDEIIEEVIEFEEVTLDGSNIENQELAETLVQDEEIVELSDADGKDEIIIETDEAEIEPIDLVTDDDGFYDEDEKLADAMIMEDEDYLEDAMQDAKEGFESEVDETEDYVFEPEYLSKKIGNDRTYDYAYAGTDADEYVTGEEDGEPNEPPVFVGMGINLPIIIIAVLILAVASLVCYCAFVVPEGEGITASQYIKDIFNTLFGWKTPPCLAGD